MRAACSGHARSDYTHPHNPQIQTKMKLRCFCDVTGPNLSLPPAGTTGVWQTLAYTCFKLGTVPFVSPASALTQTQGPTCSPQGPPG